MAPHTRETLIGGWTLLQFQKQRALSCPNILLRSSGQINACIPMIRANWGWVRIGSLLMLPVVAVPPFLSQW